MFGLHLSVLFIRYLIDMKTELITTSVVPVSVYYTTKTDVLTVKDRGNIIEFTKSEITALRDFLNQLDLTDLNYEKDICNSYGV